MTVRLHIRTRQTADGETREEEAVYTGLCRPTADGWRLTYPEGEGVAVTVAVLPGEVTVTRRGTSRSRLIFRPGERHETAYATPFGSFDLAVTTRSLQWDLSPAGGQIRLCYLLTFGGGDTLTELEIRTETV